MKILIIDTAVRVDSGGVKSILDDVYSYASKDINNAYIFLVGQRGMYSNQENISVVVREDLQKNYFRRLWFDFVSGKRTVQKMGVDVVVSLQNTGVMGLKVAQMIYVHQPLPFTGQKSFSFFKANERKLAFYQKIVGLVIKVNIHFIRNAAITVQSNWLVGNLRRYTNLPILVNKPSIDFSYLDSIPYGLESKRFFFPSTAMPYKNHKTLIVAYRSLPIELRKKFPLVLTITKDELVMLTGSEGCVGVQCIGRISRAKVLETLASSILVFPSTIETLGLPVLEAEYLGRRIIAANIPSVVELVSEYDGAQLFDPGSSSQLSKLLVQSVTQKESQSYKYHFSEDDSWKMFFDEVGKLGTK